MKYQWHLINYYSLYINGYVKYLVGQQITYFTGRYVIACGDFHQLPPIQQRPVYANFNDDMLNIDHCWRYFKIAELTEVMRQRGDQKFIDLLNNVCVGLVTEENIKMLSTGIIEPNDPNYPSDAIHIWAENVLVNQHNQNKLNELPGNKYDIIAIDKVPEILQMLC